MAKDEHRIAVKLRVGQTFRVTMVLHGSQQAQQAAHGLRQQILRALVRSNLLPACHFLERFPIGPHERVDRKFAEFQ